MFSIEHKSMDSDDLLSGMLTTCSRQSPPLNSKSTGFPMLLF